MTAAIVMGLLMMAWFQAQGSATATLLLIGPAAIFGMVAGPVLLPGAYQKSKMPAPSRREIASWYLLGAVAILGGLSATAMLFGWI